MDKLKMNKNQSLCVLSIAIVVFAQALEKILEVVITPGQFVGVICAMFYTLLVALVYFIISKGSSSFMGILAALLALKMLPPKITYLSQYSPDGAMLYYIVQKAAVVIFALLVYKFYREQEEPRQIKPLVLVALIGAVPFFNEISSYTASYLLFKTGTMVLPYFAQYACYAAAALLILGVAFYCGKESMRFAAYFQFIAFSINIFRMLGKTAYFIIAGQHVSKSIYGWIVLFAALIVIYAIAFKRNKKLNE